MFHSDPSTVDLLKRVCNDSNLFEIQFRLQLIWVGSVSFIKSFLTGGHVEFHQSAIFSVQANQTGRYQNSDSLSGSTVNSLFRHNFGFIFPPGDVTMERLLYCLFLISLFFHSGLYTIAWTQNPVALSTLSEFHQNRRTALANIGLGTAVVTNALFIDTRSALAKEPISTDPGTFETYNIIPDASANLDPKLLKVDVS